MLCFEHVWFFKCIFIRPKALVMAIPRICALIVNSMRRVTNVFAIIARYVHPSQIVISYLHSSLRSCFKQSAGSGAYENHNCCNQLLYACLWAYSHVSAQWGRRDGELIPGKVLNEKEYESYPMSAQLTYAYIDTHTHTTHGIHVIIWYDNRIQNVAKIHTWALIRLICVRVLSWKSSHKNGFTHEFDQIWYGLASYVVRTNAIVWWRAPTTVWRQQQRHEKIEIVGIYLLWARNATYGIRTVAPHTPIHIFWHASNEAAENLIEPEFGCLLSRAAC